jgi:hypothetical protein
MHLDGSPSSVLLRWYEEKKKREAEELARLGLNEEQAYRWVSCMLKQSIRGSSEQNVGNYQSVLLEPQLFRHMAVSSCMYC